MIKEQQLSYVSRSGKDLEVALQMVKEFSQWLNTTRFKRIGFDSEYGEVKSKLRCGVNLCSNVEDF